MHVSFETPEYTANADALGTLRLLEGIRLLGLENNVKFYQASTSELYGKVQEEFQNEDTFQALMVLATIFLLDNEEL